MTKGDFREKCVIAIENGLSFINRHADELCYKSEISEHFYNVINKIKNNEPVDIKRELNSLHELIENETSSVDTVFEMNRVYKVLQSLE